MKKKKLNIKSGIRLNVPYEKIITPKKKRKEKHKVDYNEEEDN